MEKIELEFSGNIFANALVLGDVDNDSVSVFYGFRLYEEDLLICKSVM